MLMIFFLYFFACSAVSHLPLTALYSDRLMDVWEGRDHCGQVGVGEVCLMNVYAGDLTGRRSLQKVGAKKKEKRWLFTSNCEVMSGHAIQHSEGSSRVPIAKGWSATCC